DQAVTILREDGIRKDLGEALADRGLAVLSAGRSAARELEEVRQIAQELGYTSEECTLGRCLMLLDRAQRAFDAGEHNLLFRRQLIEHLPQAVVRHLRDSGQLPGEGPRASRSVKHPIVELRLEAGPAHVEHEPRVEAIPKACGKSFVSMARELTAHSSC